MAEIDVQCQPLSTVCAVYTRLYIVHADLRHVELGLASGETRSRNMDLFRMQGFRSD